MATLPQLEAALIGADKAGDMDAARRLAAALVQMRKSGATGDLAEQIPGNEAQTAAAPAQKPGMLAQGVQDLLDAGSKALQLPGAVGEAALALGTGATGGALGMLGGAVGGIAGRMASAGDNLTQPQAAQLVEQAAMEGAAKGTYQPRTTLGQQITQAGTEILQSLLPVAPMTTELGAIAQGVKGAVPIVSATAQEAAAGRLPGAVTPIGEVAQTLAKGGEQGAAVPIPAVPISGQPVPRASVGAAAVDLPTLRTAKAENLPVPITLTQGAATRDAAQLAFEKEQMKGELGGPLRARAEENNLQALQNFDAIIDMTGAQTPDIASSGNPVVKALSQGWEAAKNRTRIAYQDARAAGELEAPVEYAPIIDFIDKQTPTVQQKLAPILTAVKEQILQSDPEGRGEISLNAMEDVRQMISKNTEFGTPNSVYGGELKKLIDAATEGKGGALYQKARALRFAQARKYEDRAIVARLITDVRGMADPKVAVDQVFNRSILNGSPEEITFLKRVLLTSGSGGKQAWSELQGATMQHIKAEATKGMGMDSADRPLVSPAKLHQAVSALDKNGRLDLMLGKKNAQTVRDLNEVVRYVTTTPPGTLINNSGTVGTLLAAIGEAGVAGSLTGLPVPVLSTLRLVSQGIKNQRMKSKINQALNAKKAGG